jgi:cyclic-di-GMP phosphodiesterase TipF (flagellum assembly factor)
MRRLTLGLLVATYICLALIVAFSLWRNGGGWGAGVAAMVGTLGLCFAFHGLIGRSLESGELRAEIEAVRDAHKILIDQVEALDARMGEIAEAVEGDAQRADALVDEVHLLEDLVQRLQARLDEHGEEEPLTLTASIPGLARAQPPALLEVVRAALAENRVDLYLQPIVALPQRKTLYYESFSRLRDATGRVMMPAEYLTVAEPCGLVTAIDNLLLFRCVQIVRRLARQDRRIGIFCNISMASLADESFFPQFLELLSANRDLAGSLIFELGQAAFDARGSIEARNMGKLADLGFRFSLDKVSELDLDLQDLSRSDVKFVKVAAQPLLDQLEEHDGRLVIAAMPDLAAEDFAALTRRFGVELIVEKVENERQVAEVLDLGVGFGQGHLFGEPRAIKDQVLAEAGPPPPMIRASLARAAFG